MARVSTVVHESFHYTRPWMYPKQIAAIFNSARYSVVEAGTKSGKTVGCIVWLAEQAMQGKPGMNFWWIAPVYQQAKIAFTRMKRSLPSELYISNEGDLTIRLIPSDTLIWFKSAEKPDNLYGEDVGAAVIDEASRVRQEAWYAVRSTLTATRGPLRLIGNVKGKKNWFYNLARKAESGARDMEFHKITSMDAANAGVLDKEEIEDAQSVLPKDVFKELYNAEASDDAGNPFGIADIAACTKVISKREPAVWAWDLAKSVDWTVGIALDDAGDTCRYERFQKPWIETKRTISNLIGDTPTLVDSTGVGDPILEDLQKTNPNVEGYKFSSTSKQILMEGLALAIQHHEIGYPDGAIAIELSNFEYEYTRTGVKYSAPVGMNDDCVCSLALARYHYKDQIADGGMMLRWA